MPTQQLGIFAKTFTRSSIDSNLEAVRSHGLDVVQFNMACAGLPSLPRHIDPDLAQQIGQAAAAHGIRIAAVSGTFNMIDPVVERRHEGLRRLHELASHCAALGTRMITLCTGTRDAEDMWRAHRDNASRDAWIDLFAAMDVAIAIADEFDVDLGIEPEIANVVCSPLAALRLIHEMRSPRLKIVLDAANLLDVGDLAPRRQRAILDDAVEILDEYIVMAHAKDVRAIDGEIAHVAAGTGVLDYDYYLHLLAGLEVPLVVHGLSEFEVPRALEFLRSKTVHEHEEEEPWLLSA
jgi:sugar phosphate isomerase/epimerase